MPTPDEKMMLEEMRSKSMQRQGDVEAVEDEGFSAAAPKGKFSAKALNNLVEATNRLLPLFGIEDKYARFSGDATVFPTDFVRILSMFSAAISDAVSAGALPEDAVFDLKLIVDDSGIIGLAGRINMAAKSGGLKRFLKGKVAKPEMEEELPEESTEEEDMESPESTDKLFASRM